MRTCIIFFVFVFISPLHAQVYDIDSNAYTIVTIGSQDWFGENLRTSRFNDGTQITELTDSVAWRTATDPAMCWYDNDSSNSIPYGRLYNGFAALSDHICPQGWRVPSEADWLQLMNHLGGASVAGGKLKHSGTQYWEPPNTGATNSSGFTAVPSGFRSNVSGSFDFKGFRAGWFSLAGRDLQFRWVSWTLESAGGGSIAENTGLAIRCMRPARVSVDEFDDRSSIKIWPNPSNEVFNFEFPVENNQAWSIRIYDLTGRLVLETPEVLNTIQLNLGHLPKGSYFVNCKSGEHSVIQKLIIQ
jgi:uncharacterized protein (TIGR02145 family)